jgi:hypothetical protein
MTIATEESDSTSAALPEESDNLIDEGIGSMSEEELRAWKRDSEKTMSDSKSRSDASPAVAGF